MNRDTLENSICQALDGRIDPDVFEDCACDLLRLDYPGLAPVRGGADGGFDGAVATNQGPFPLVCTVGKRVLENVRKNLHAYLSTSSGPKRAVVATTQNLTAQRRANIIKEAGLLGVTIVNVHDRSYFVNRLYSDSRWRKELLGVTGNPPALSRIPDRPRPFLPIEPIGRESLLSSIRQSTGDLLLVGQPGVGKTYLHEVLALDEECVFAVESDSSRLADAIREQHPPVIVVDDAHARQDRLLLLSRLREELGAGFCIHANSWLADRKVVQSLMKIGDQQVLHVDLLSRDEILKIVNACGLGGPRHLLHLILDQAGGRPGLACALCNAIRQHGAIKKLWTGELLAEQMFSRYENTLTTRHRSILGSMAVAGDSGMTLKQVASFLGIPEVDVRECVVNLGDGGIVEEHEDRVAIRPQMLRSPLVHETFFKGAGVLSIDDFLQQTDSLANSLTEIMLVHQRLGDVPLSLIEQRITEVEESDSWEHFSWLSKDAAQLILDKFPEKIDIAASGLLHFQAEAVLPHLFNQIRDDLERSETAQPKQEDVISTWLIGREPDRNSTHGRRVTLVSALESWYDPTEPSDGRVAGRLLSHILDPHYHRSEAQPGSGRSIAIISGLVQTSDIEGICGLWPTLKDLMAKIESRYWSPILPVVEKWTKPGRFLVRDDMDDELAAAMRSAGKLWVKDISVLRPESNALQVWAHGIAGLAGFETPVAVDSLYQALYSLGRWGRGDDESNDRKCNVLAATAEEWVDEEAHEVFQRVNRMDREAYEIGGLSVGYGTRRLCFELAQRTSDTLSWVRSAMALRVDPNLINQFFRAKPLLDDPDVISILVDMINDDLYLYLGVSLTLEHPHPNEELLGASMSRIGKEYRLDACQCHVMSIPVPTMLSLLRHPVRAVRVSAAISEWLRNPKEQVRDELLEDWERAVAGAAAEDDYWLGEILEAKPKLAREWAHDVFKRAREDILDVRELLGRVRSHLPLALRREIILSLDRGSFDDDCFHLLLEEDIEVFAEWIRTREDDYLRLLPLRLEPGRRWETLAVVALNNDVKPSELKGFCYPWHWSGGAEVYERRIAEYERMLAEGDPRLREPISHALKSAKASLARDREEERRERVYGLSR